MLLLIQPLCGSPLRRPQPYCPYPWGGGPQQPCPSSPSTDKKAPRMTEGTLLLRRTASHS